MNATTGPARRRCFDFSASDYRSLIRGFAELGYKTVKLDEIQPDHSHLFLRHDVDMSLERAVAIAAIETEEAVIATYYVLISTSAYNPASARSRELLRKLAELGHAIGLHFDAAAYSGTAAELEQYAIRECEILEDLSRVPVDSISFHRPAPELLGWQGQFAGRPHTYERRFTDEIGYVSDSSGGFFHGHPLDHPGVAERRAIQVLTHPIWWHAQERKTAAELLEELREERHAMLDRILFAATAKARTRVDPTPKDAA